MIDTQALRKKILDAAIRGKLTERLPEDGNAENLYNAIQEEKQNLIKEGKIKKEKSLPEIAEDGIPFNISENWKWVRLGDITIKAIKRGKSPHYATTGNTLVFAQKCNTKAGYINLGLAQYLDESYLDAYPLDEFLCDCDVVINSTGGGTLGRVGIYRESDNPRTAPVVPDSHVTVIRSMNSTMQLYLYRVLKFMQPELEEMGTGSTNQNELRPDTVKELLIPLPPLAEQKRIVAKLDSIFSQLDLIDEQQKKLSDNAQPLRNKLIELGISGELTEQLPEDGNAEDLYKAIYAEKQKLIKEGKIKKEKPLPEIAEKEIPFVIPENWKWVRLQEIGSDFADGPFGSNLKKEHYTTRPEVRIVQLSNIGENGWRNENEKYTTFNHLKTIQRSEVNPGDIVIAKMMPAGRAIILPDLGTKYVLSSDGVKVVPLTKIFCPWLLYAINSTVFRNQIYSEVQGVTRIRTSLSKLKTYLLPLPPLAEQNRIVEKLDQLLPLCDAMRADISGGVGA